MTKKIQRTKATHDVNALTVSHFYIVKLMGKDGVQWGKQL